MQGHMGRECHGKSLKTLKEEKKTYVVSISNVENGFLKYSKPDVRVCNGKVLWS